MRSRPQFCVADFRGREIIEVRMRTLFKIGSLGAEIVGISKETGPPGCDGGLASPGAGAPGGLPALGTMPEGRGGTRGSLIDTTVSSNLKTNISVLCRNYVLSRAGLFRRPPLSGN